MNAVARSGAPTTIATPTAAVIGPGAIGGAIAGAVVEVGGAPVLAARTPFDRLIVEHPGGRIEAPARCMSNPTDLGPDEAPIDLVFLAVKAHQTQAVSPWLDALVGPGTVVVILQNGVEHLERVGPLVTPGAVLVPAVVQLPARRLEPGHVEVTGRARLAVPRSAGGEYLAGALADSFVRVKLADDWRSEAWIKLMMNAASGGLCTLARTDNTVFVDADARALAIAVMREVADVGRACGATLADDLPDRIMDGLAAQASGHMSSIVVDRINGVATEWDARNGVVTRLANKHGLDVPLNHMLTTVIRMGEPTTPEMIPGG